MNKKIRFTMVADNSGYGYANKQLFMSLLNVGLDITPQVINTPMSRHDYAQDSIHQTLYERLNSNIKPDINIVQLVPVLFDYGFQKNTYNIGFIFWESSRICQKWVDIINNGLANEIWVPCPSNYHALINSGVKKPVFIIPQYIKTNLMSKEEAQTLLPIPYEDYYRFYSVFQWTDRKNPQGLIRAFYNEFSNNDKVMLVVKTYGASAFADRRWIKETILNLKEKSGNKNPAPLYLFGELLTPDEVLAIHPQCNTYVYCGRGEGLNIPLVEAMNYKHQIITTKLGGITDWMDNGGAYIIPHTLEVINTINMPWGSFYQSSPAQMWGSIRDEDIQQAMRQAYDERFNYQNRIAKYDDILHRCSEEIMVRKIKERLKAIR